MDEKEPLKYMSMRKGNIVKWSDGLWIVTDWVENIVEAKHTIRCKLVSFEHVNVSATLTNKPDTRFDVRDVKFVALSAKSFIMGRLEKAVLGI